MSFAMPAVEVGDIVHWFRNGVQNETQRFPAMVLGIQHRSVMLKVFSAFHRDLVVESCKHADDPEAKPEDRSTDGSWKHRHPVVIKKDK